MFLLKVTEALKDNKVDYTIAGGYAVNFHGVVRGTVDIDLVIKHSAKQFKALEKALSSIGLSSKIPVSAEEVFNFKDEYIKNRNLVTWSFVNPTNPTELVDVVLTHDLADLDSVSVKVKSRSIKILSKDSLIKMKKAAKRPQDLEDIKALKRIGR